MTTPSGLAFLALHPFVRATAHDKIKGTIVGSALGDCIGLYTEFLPKSLCIDAYPEKRFQLIDPPTEFRNDGHRKDKFQIKAWTDDTDHALLILLSYLHHDGQKLAPNDVAERLKLWVEQGLRVLDRPPLGLGATVGSVVSSKDYLANPAQRAYNSWLKSNRYIAPNGSLMRTHPLGVICLVATLQQTFQIAANYSAITHADPRCIVACCTVTALIRGILRGEVLHESNVDKLMEEAYAWTKAWLEGGREGSGCNLESNELHETGALLDMEEYARHGKVTSFAELQLDDGQKMGYVYKAFGAAVLSLRMAMRQAPCDHTMGIATTVNPPKSTVFENIITELTFEGGDADTNACVAGALLGCWLGYDALPPQWRDGMQHQEWMVGKCQALSQMVGVGQGEPRYKGSQDPDTAIDGGRGLLSADEVSRRDKQFMYQYLMRSEEATEREKRRLGEGKKSKKTGWGGVFSSLKG
ncbi:hypothetical protein FQN52_009215 [Onygenales sp. PD_12]|nr:hypothetical protein FQN52_009215 [Onygenales sp. PD_12]